MAVAMFLRVPVPARTYRRLLEILEWDASPPAGGILHVAAEAEDGLEICEVWRTRATAEGFLRDRLTPILEELGATEPVEHAILPLHNLFAADLETIERIGTVSLPGLRAGAIIR